MLQGLNICSIIRAQRALVLLGKEGEHRKAEAQPQQHVGMCNTIPTQLIVEKNGAIWTRM
jgi:hypothetical protein